VKNFIRAGFIVAIVIVGVALASPLFYDTDINEPLPVELEKIKQGLTYDKFATMDDDDRQLVIEKMPEKVKEMVMVKAETMVTTVSEEMDEIKSDSPESSVERQKGLQFVFGIKEAVRRLRWEIQNIFAIKNGSQLLEYRQLVLSIEEAVVFSPVIQ